MFFSKIIIDFRFSMITALINPLSFLHRDVEQVVGLVAVSAIAVEHPLSLLNMVQSVEDIA